MVKKKQKRGKKMKKTKVMKSRQEEKDEKGIIDGFLCPRCRFKMNVYLTKPLTGSIYRIRICRRCGERLSTEEHET